MGGAYVAKPDPAPTPLPGADGPPGWDEDWLFPPTGSFPGPSPPGYEYDFSLNLSGPSSLFYSSAAAVTVSLRDHDTYETAEPSGSVVTWTATIDGASVPLKFSGDPSYSSSIESSYSDLDPYWGAQPSIEFQVDETDGGSTLVLQAVSVVDDEDLSVTIGIEILESHVYTARVSASWDTPTNILNWTGSYPAHFWRISLYVDDPPYNRAYSHHYYDKTGDSSFAWDSNEYEGNAYVHVSGSDLTAVIDMDDLLDVCGGDDVEIDVASSNYSGKCDGSASVVLTVYEDGVTKSVHNLTVTVTRDPYVPTVSHAPWVRIDPTTGAVTVVNP